MTLNRQKRPGLLERIATASEPSLQATTQNHDTLLSSTAK